METKSLINICQDLLEVDSGTEESKELIYQRLNQLDNKVDNYVGIYKFADSQILMLKEEIDHLKNQIKRYEKFQEHLENRAKYALELLGETRIKSDRGHKISIMESESVDVIDIEKVPEKYIRIKMTKEADKIAIKYAMKQGEIIPGCQLIINKNVQLK